jgi:hypothetical protein
MNEPRVIRFDTRRELELQFRACVEAAQGALDLFDPDFSVYPLGTLEIDTLLRALLARGGRLRLALHDTAHIERNAPRFLRLLRDFSHLCECRQTPRGLRQLTDSFCIGDERDIVRRFHSDHFRGEASFGDAIAIDLPRHRFDAIWVESRITLQPTVAGL